MKLLEMLRLRSDDGTGTRLELAKTFADMGDPDLARSLLDEVISEGSEDQRKSAETLMAEL